MTRVKIIAEIGSSPAPAWDFEPWCGAAAAAGADAVKVQLFRAAHFPAAEQDEKRRLEFPRERLAEFARCAHAFGLTAGASVFDSDAIELAVKWCDWLKLAAREENNRELFPQAWYRAGDRGKVLYRSQSSFEADLPLMAGRGFVPLHAMQAYPAAMAAAVYRLLRWWRWAAQKNVEHWGWSSHTTGWLDCALAARLGATVIEKHLCRFATDIEAGHSLTPFEFARMVTAVRRWTP